MNKILKLKKVDPRNVVFVSDLHLGHDKEFLWGGRGFDSIEEYDEMIIETWKRNFNEDTIVFDLGDVCFNDPNRFKFHLLSTMPCKEHYLLWGNHNSGALSTHKRECRKLLKTGSNIAVPEIYPIKYNNVTFVGHDLIVVFDDDIEISLSHLPKRVWDHLGHGAWHLNGHSHGTDETRNVDSKSGKTLDVGVDNALVYTGKFWFTLEEIKDIMDEKFVELKDHHDHTINKSR